MTAGRTPVHRWLLWGSMASALAASWSHVVGAFGRLEHGGPPAWVARVGPWASVLAAVALDLGLISLAWAIGARRRMGRPANDLWPAVGVFAGLSAFANASHALGVVLDGAPVTWARVVALDGWTLASVAGLAAALPLLALWLARVVEVDADLEAGEAALPLQPRNTGAPGSEAGGNGRADLRAEKRDRAAGSSAPKSRPRRAGPADLAALVTLDPWADVTTLAARLGVSRPTVYAWASAAGLARDDAGRWTGGGAAVQSN